MVSGDLAYLKSACQLCQPFSEAVDLGKLAKEHHLVPSTKPSLSDLCAAILHWWLDKNVLEQVSSQWESEILTKEQVDYAACNTYVSLILYHVIVQTSIPTPVSPDPPAGLPVLIYYDDNTCLVAYSHIIKHINTTEIKGARVSSQHEVVHITQVIILGAILKTYQWPLSSFGQTPFDIVVIHSHLRLLQTYSQMVDSSTKATSSWPANQAVKPFHG